MFKIDLHTHSIASKDGGISAEQYAHVLSTHVLDMIAITDHNQIEFAQKLQAKLGDRIIVGEEIMSTGGEIIGLYLKERIAPRLSPQETVKQIKDQGGIVYIPHPFENIRKGLHPGVLEELVDEIDIVEVCNGRAFLQDRSAQALVWAKLNHIIGAASSDAHGVRGLGRTYMDVSELPEQHNLVELLGTSVPVTSRPSMRALLYPKYHSFRRKMKRS